jgi:hypothetical protein
VHYAPLRTMRASLIAEGSTIVTTSDAKGIIERAVQASHLMQPDALSRTPRAPVIEVVADTRVFEDGTRRVELHQIGPNAHA